MGIKYTPPKISPYQNDIKQSMDGILAAKNLENAKQLAELEMLDEMEQEESYRRYSTAKRMVAKKISGLFSDILKDFKIDANDLKVLNETKPIPLPGFPLGMIILAAIIDILGFLNIGIVTTIFIFPITLILNILLIFYMFGRVSGLTKGGLKTGALLTKWLIKRITKKGALVILLKLIPIINFIPWNVIFVLLANYEHTKIVQTINIAAKATKEISVKFKIKL